MYKTIEEEVKKHFEENSGWIKHNGLQIDEITKEKVTTSVELTKNHLNPHGIAHGGLIFGLADSSMGMLASLTGKKVVTVNSTINYLRPCGGSKLVCIAEPVKVGITLGVYKASIYNDKNEERRITK